MTRGPALLRCVTSRPVSLAASVGFPIDVVPSPTPGAIAPALLGGSAGHMEAGREPGSLCLPLASAEAGSPGSLRVAPVQGVAMGCPWRVPPASVLSCVRCGGLACGDPVTAASSFPYCPSFDGGLGRGTGALSFGRQHLLVPVAGHHARVQRVCARGCSSQPGRAGWRPRRVLLRLTFSLAVLSFLLGQPPPGWGCPA